uniref:FAD-dependent oxidoreductase domain-containing protein 2 n=1 Tax=Oncorhynchus tshawytscha TaxID=74940 RepID=A0A8C8JV81_ONCTS
MDSPILLLLARLVALVQCFHDDYHSHNSTRHHDYCVLGAGPAGLQMGHFLSKSQREYIILERNSGPGSFFNMKLISINKIYTGRRNREFNLRHDWNSLLSDRPDLLLQRVSRELYPDADSFPRYLSMYVKELGLKVQYGVDIGKIRASESESPRGRGYILTDQRGLDYTCRVLLVSTGLWDPQKVQFEGSDLVEGYESIPVDPEEYKDQAVLILGKGNSAFETAQSILGRASRIHLYSPSPVRLAWQTHYVGDLRTLLSSEGARGRLPGVTAWYEGRGTPDLFVLGTAAHSRDYRSSAGGFIHGFRYTVRAVHRVLELRYHSNSWPAIKLSISQLQSWLLRRVNEASGPYQMFGVLGDIILLRGSHCEYLEEFPLQALPQFSSLSGHQLSKHGLLVLVLQYGLNRTDSLGPGRAESEWTRAWRSNFLHPVLYYYDKLPTERDMRHRPVGWPLPRPKAVHHMIEDFLTEWDGPISHSQPLRRFLEHCLHTDLRAFYAESCFRLSLTNRKPPLFCRQGYLRKHGIVRNSQLWQHAYEAGLMPGGQDSASTDTDPAFPDYLTRAGASVSSAINFDF